MAYSLFMHRRFFIKSCAAAGLAGLAGCFSGGSGRGGLRSRLEAASDEARRQIADKLIAGAVFAIGNRGPAVALGEQCWSPRHLPMTEASVFDLASVGKTFTASLCARLVTAGKLDPDAPFTEYLPEHVLAKGNGKITIRDLATHSGGFDNSKPYQVPDMAKFRRELFAKRPAFARREKFVYSCSNFILLGLVVERLTGENLDAAARRLLWGPLGMTQTTWLPVKDNGHVVQFPGPHPIGQHNDDSCFYSPDPLGNGSAFSTVGDMRLFVTDLLERRHFPKDHYALLFAPTFEKNGDRRSFGFDMGDKLRPEGYSRATIFHSGWTGQTIAVDPERGFCGVVLTNRTGDHDEGARGRARVLSLLAGGKSVS